MNICKTSYLLALLFSLIYFESTAQEFVYGVYMDKGDSVNQRLYAYVKDSLSMNTIFQYANSSNELQKSKLSKFNLTAIKLDSPKDAVAHYCNACYTKWEAEDTVVNTLGTGIKASFGNETVHNGIKCWTSGTDLSKQNSVLIYGPDYRQNKKYAPYYLQHLTPKYTINFKIAAKDIHGVVSVPGEPVCKIEVIFRYKQQEKTIEYQFPEAQKILYANSFQGESFADYSFEYSYPKQFLPGQNFSFDDTQSKTGISIKVTWFGMKQLFIDCIEVFDQEIGIDFVKDRSKVEKNIAEFVSSYKSWSKINYFFSISEPQTLDNYTPMRIVDEILGKLGKPRTVAEFYPQYDGWRNGDRTLYKFRDMAQPQKLMMEYITFIRDVPLEFMFESQRIVLQEAASVDPHFWYESVIAEPALISNNQKCWLYMPTREQLNASLMLSMAHGAKGLIFWKLVPDVEAYEFNCGGTVWYNVIFNRESQPNLEIYNFLRNDLARRLNGQLGNLLMKLKYTSHFLQLKNLSSNSGTIIKPVTHDYLTIGLKSTEDRQNWHVGFLEDTANSSENKYFFLVNLLTDSKRFVDVKITSPDTNYVNYRFRNIETNLDTSFTSSLNIQLYHKEGEGYLYQTAPVVKYGGKLVKDEKITSPTTLNGDMEILNGAALHLYTEYTAKGNIIVRKGGKIIKHNGAALKFDKGKKLIAR